MRGMERSVTLIKMHNFALLASEWRRFCCICIKSVRPEMAPKPTTAKTTTATKPWRLRFAAVMQFICQLLCTLLLLLCLCFFCPAALGVLFTFRIGFHFFMRDSFRPATLRPVVILLRSAFISRMSERALGALRQPAASSLPLPFHASSHN